MATLPVSQPFGVVFMGISGCGKSTHGALTAHLLNAPFIEGDHYHGPANIALMADAIPLTDENRRPWLIALGTAINRELQRHDIVVASCSSLRRQYRDLLRAQTSAALLFVYLAISSGVAHERVAKRKEHYMPVALVDSQLAALEIPIADEWHLSIDAAQPVNVITNQLEMEIRRIAAKPLP